MIFSPVVPDPSSLAQILPGMVWTYLGWGWGGSLGVRAGVWGSRAGVQGSLMTAEPAPTPRDWDASG